MQNNDTQFDFDQEPGAQPTSEAAPEEAAVETTQKPKPNMVEIVKKNWLYVAIGVVVFGVVWYLMSDIIFPPAPPAKAPPVRVAAPQKAQAQWVDTGAAQSASAAPGYTLSKQDFQTLVQGFESAVKQQVGAASNQINQNLVTLQQNYQQQQADLLVAQRLAQQEVALARIEVNTLQREVTTMNKEFVKYNQSLQKMNQSLQTTQEQLRLLLAEQEDSSQQFTLRAVVPGRAWVVDADGRTVSIVKGSILGNYGTVTKIDSDQGKVYMSSGYVFN